MFGYLPCKVNLIILGAILMVSDAHAFELNFNRPPGNSPAANWQFSCDPGFNPGGSEACGGLNDKSEIAFYTVRIGRQQYYRTIIGNPASGFAMDFYTRATSAGVVGLVNGRGVDGGGNEPSSGSSCDPNANSNNGVLCGNALNPFGIGVGANASGIGVQDPTKIVFRMVLSDGGMDQEIVKPLMNRKPKITQSLSDGDLQTSFIADMRELNYQDQLTAAPVNLKQNITDATFVDPGAGNFDITNSPGAHVTAGQYQYTPGAGWDAGFTTFGAGSYSYKEDSMDVQSIDWSSYFDPAQNAVFCGDPATPGTRASRRPLSCPN